MFIAQGPLAHVGQLDGALRAGVHKPVAAGGVEFGSGDDFGEFLHISGFNIDNVKALILNVKVPKVDTKVIAAYESLSVTVDGDTVDVVCMGVGICPSGNGGHDGIMMGHPRELQQRRVLERRTRRGSRDAAAADGPGGRELVGQVVLGDDLERLIEDFP